MALELSTLFLAGVGYLVVLFLVAHAVDSGRVPERYINNPWTYTLSLGVYATTWSYYGSVGFAQTSGYQFLTLYLGAAVAFILGPVLLQPILRLTREYQLSSLADLFAFRYRSQYAGVLVTLIMLLGALPYLALQIHAVTESIHILTQEAPPNVIAVWYCVMMTLFAILFGARHISPRDRHRGLVAAIAFESLVKLLAILTIGLASLYGVFGGFDGLQSWLSAHPETLDQLYRPVREGPWATYLLLAFAAAFLLPKQFHMAFTENFEARHQRTAAWGFPLFLFLFSLMVPLILFGGQALGLTSRADFFGLGIMQQVGPDWLTVLAFLGGLSAASAMIIVTTLALSSMSLNNLLIPANYPDPSMNLYRWLLLGRRVLIAIIILAAFGFYIMLKPGLRLLDLGLISFVAVAQFLPGIVGLLFWQRATRTGFNWGLLAGIGIWFVLVILPLLAEAGVIRLTIDIINLHAGLGLERWEFVTFVSLAINGLVFVILSLLTEQSDAEQQTARACCSDSFLPLEGVVMARSPAQFAAGLAVTLGQETAEREVSQALKDLRMSTFETRSSELRRLRDRIERNLSGLMGPQMAHMIINRRLSLDAHAKTALADSMRFMEERLEQSRSQLEGMNAELDTLRRLHRQILQDLPLGVCATDSRGSVVMWNLAMEHISGVPGREAFGTLLRNLKAPWNDLLNGFAHATDDHLYRMEIELGGRVRWVNLHKAAFADPGFVRGSVGHPGMVMLLEDLTDLENLEAELAHSDRLASVGRLAAGVAHEIGNPVTGIASIAQNLRHEDDPALVRDSVDNVLELTGRISNILKSLMSFSRGSAGQRSADVFPLCEVIDESVHLVRLAHKTRDIVFESECQDDIFIQGDRQQVAQVLVNLLKNAGDASQPGDRVQLMARHNDIEAIVEVMDQGEGIPVEKQGLVFEPFFTTKPAGEGTGLGLALVYKIVQDHEGTIEIDSQPGVGTRVQLTFPMIATGELRHESYPDR